jgi:hypothetical protein
MSITIYPRYDWEMVESPCTMCGDDCDKGTDMNPHCTGIRRDPPCPTIQMSNSNAYAMLALLGIDADYSGHVDAEDLPRIRRAIIKARNMASVRSTATAEPYESGGPGTGQCRVVYCGRDEYYVSRRLGDLMELVEHCQEKECGFYWC